MDFDSSWCPVCDRQILPKRYQVPVPPPPPPPPAAPPSSPQSSPPKSSGHVKRAKPGVVRPRVGGLVHGTGRVKPNGALKRSDSGSKKVQSLPQPPKNAAARHRTIIDQGPIPLYCSDECRLADINSSSGLPLDYNPDRQSPPLPPVPHNSFSNDSDSSDSSGNASSFDSHSSMSSNPSTVGQQTYRSSSIATLAAIYNFPPLPPPPPIYEDHSSDTEVPEYNSGIMMAAKRIEALCPKPPKRNPDLGRYQPAPEPRKPIPGWNDGSHAWRSTVYSFTSPKNAADPARPDEAPMAYRSCVATPHRSRGVYSTLGDSSPAASAALPLSAPVQPARSPETEELMTQYHLAFARNSRSQFSPSSVSSSSLSTSATRRERSLLQPGAEGKLLVPDVKLRVRTGSNSSLPSVASSTRRSVRSPLSRYGSELSEEDAEALRCDSATSLPSLRRPVVETRSWSYDNLKTYPIMPLPTQKEKRTEKRVVDGEEVEVEVEVEVPQKIKRLFLFADKEI